MWASACWADFLTLNGSITVGDIQAFTQYVRQFTQPINQIANISNVLQMTAAAAERVFAFWRKKRKLPTRSRLFLAENIDGSVYFAHVHFGYVPEKPSSTIFPPLSSRAPRWQSSDRPERARPPWSSCSCVFMMSAVGDPAQWVRCQAVQPQHPARQLWHGAAGHLAVQRYHPGNIRFGRLDATDEEVVAAAKAAQVDHFVRTLPHGYDTVLNEEASNISQGQKQLLTIARTILSIQRF